PDKAVDPVVIGASLVMALQTVVSRNVPPSETAIITIGAFLAGDAPNVIPQSAELRLSIRALNPQIRPLLRQRVQALAEHHAESFGASAEVTFDNGYPVLVNDPAASQLASDVIRDWLGAEGLAPGLKPICATDDFASSLAQVTGCYRLMGNGEGGGGWELQNHADGCNGQARPLGATFRVRLAQRVLA